jgi:MoxR-like ATPase
MDNGASEPERKGKKGIVDIEQLSKRAQAITDEVETALLGKHQSVLIALSVLMSNGHLLIEDIPGVGKTTLAKSLAHAFGCEFKRIQFTPDLLPSDITGVSLYNIKTSDFEFRPGPVFANVILADEINRATPKTQSALLECMEEHQVTVDGTTHSLPSPFFVIATQNNVEISGTYPLPEAQLDRFTARIYIGYPSREYELQIMDNPSLTSLADTISPIMSGEELHNIQQNVRKVHVDTTLRGYIMDIVTATRNHPAVILGVSPRGALALMHCSQAFAAINGRDYVLPDDIKLLAAPILAHRITLRPERKMKGENSETLLKDILSKIAVPIISAKTLAK